MICKFPLYQTPTESLHHVLYLWFLQAPETKDSLDITLLISDNGKG